jgi:hypothetical protein
MKKSVVVVLKVMVFTCCCFVIYCNAAFSSVTGVYINEEDRKEYLVFYENGTFFVNDLGGIFGQYTVDGSVITFIIENYEDPVSGLIEGDVITIPDETPLVKYEIPTTSEDARKALEQMGIDYTESAFREHAYDGDLIAVGLFVNAGMDVNANGEDGETALMLAAYKGGPVVVQVLLDKGAEINVKEDDGWTALMIAADEGNPVIAQMLLDKGADVNMQDEDGETALMKASARGHLAIVQLLLDNGAEVNVKDEDEKTALAKATAEGHEKIIQLLKQSGATEK